MREQIGDSAVETNLNIRLFKTMQGSEAISFREAARLVYAGRFQLPQHRNAQSSNQTKAIQTPCEPMHPRRIAVARTFAWKCFCWSCIPAFDYLFVNDLSLRFTSK